MNRLLLTALLFSAVLPLSAQVPQILNYQGRISAGDTPFTGTGQFRFALVNGDGTASYWSNDGTSAAGSQPTASVALPVVNGLYVVPLGDTALANMTAIPPTVFTNGDVRVRVWFNDGSTGSQLLSPDQRITAVGYAMVAGTAATVLDGAITAAKLAPGITVNGNVTGNAGTATNATELTALLGNPGTLNQGSNPVEWTQLKGVPPGFADGTDNVGVTSITAGNGLTGGTITESGTIHLSGDVPLLSNASNSFSGQIAASSFLGNGGGLTNLSGISLQNNSVPLSALAAEARPKYDRQQAAPPSFSLSAPGTWVDLNGITVTTKSLGDAGTYTLSFSSTIYPAFPSFLRFRFVVNGTYVTGSELQHSFTAYQFSHPSMTSQIAGVSAGSVIKVQVWINSSNSMDFYNTRLIIDGVPTSQVVP